MIGFDLDDEHRDLQERARQVADAVRPLARRWDEDEVFPEASLDVLRSSGLLGLTVPVEHGGHGKGVFEACLVLEEIAAGCMATAIVAQMFLNGPPRALAVVGTAEQQARLLPGVGRGERYFAIAMTEPGAGSSGTELVTRLTRGADGVLRLTGTKCYITGGDRADTLLVFCRAAGSSGARGIGAVVVERGQPGFDVVETSPKMGSRGVAEATLRFEGVEIDGAQVVVPPDPDSTAGARLLLRQFNPERCGNAAMCLGVARAALEDSVAYTAQREQFGRPIVEFQGLQWKLADMAVRLETARLALWRAAVSTEDGFPALRHTAVAKLVANEAAQFVTNEAIQLHGHRGYTRDVPVERYFRDVRGMALAGGTSEVLRNIIAEQVTGRRFAQRPAGAP
ncbi:acyl-CoA dehydrogenase family protein [Geodermatophilus sp. DSM 44513]|uniref:acyl-CoA dehydrogenase family protein n=1 Tax=Geodermatophilus sp. DSM 44513 TaxID=1528104 RepID=UPI00128034F8|nr:acyl-CoA dehydrogenase family protein [Geodermatophilus sp. DSM 44513]WNV76638.1 acyl-CoA dehydrogenase family protein [Geodermatophilus sp. DSM 44513]